MKAKQGRWGQQPAKAIINRHSAATHRRHNHNGDGRIAKATRLLSKRVGYEVKPSTLRAYLDGVNVPPAEVKIGLALVIKRSVDECWTPEVLDATYVGPRGFGTAVRDAGDS